MELANSNLRLIQQMRQAGMLAGINNLYRIDTLLMRLFLIKAGFRPDQPRVPAGNPDGGQWTREHGVKIARALNHLRLYARRESKGDCGRYVANALREGKIADIWQHGENFGPHLLANGFYMVVPDPCLVININQVI
ncbi:MAG: hypothetical protein JSS50_02620 [Proteobacteria bacterium]|nr:hypothetical protein [Pseudomonadota bacterium]